MNVIESWNICADRELGNVLCARNVKIPKIDVKNAMNESISRFFFVKKPRRTFEDID